MGDFVQTKGSNPVFVKRTGDNLISTTDFFILDKEEKVQTQYPYYKNYFNLLILFLVFHKTRSLYYG